MCSESKSLSLDRVHWCNKNILPAHSRRGLYYELCGTKAKILKLKNEDMPLEFSSITWNAQTYIFYSYV